MYKTGKYHTHKFYVGGEWKAFYSSEKNKTAAWVDICNQKTEYELKVHEQKNNFKVLAERMLEQQEKSVGHSCAESYGYAVKHLAPFFDMDIQDIKPIDVQRLLDEMAKQQYSYSAVSKTKIVFGLTLKYAILYENLPLNNFMNVIKVPKNTHKGRVKSPDDEVIDAIIKNAYTAKFGLWAVSLLCTGIRRGELNALQVKDIDFKNMQIPIIHAVEFINNQPNIKDAPKTESGIRKQPILDIYLPFLKTLCDGRAPDEFLFGGEKPLTKTQITKRWNVYKKEVGHDFNGHQLRHAYAYLLYRAGYDPKTMQHLLGHANFSTTMNIYTEFSREVEQAKLKDLNDYMSKTFMS
jgi:integrase